jgi:hypothetical protein
MKLFKSRLADRQVDPSPGSKLDRRGLVLGAGLAGVAAVAVQALKSSAPEPTAALAPKVQPEKGDGYQVTQHVLRYYETTKV